jgi:peptidoglycan/LPS O-acetylase OafA/YrhL
VLHVSREVFFLLTAFVLVYSYRKRPAVRWPAFWRRRYLLIGVPYVVWSAIYFLLLGGGWHPGEFAYRVLTGTAQYHLYFLLVSMQLYLVFPLLRLLLNRTGGRHGRLLAAAVIYQTAAYWLLPHRVSYPDPLLISYAGFVVVGGIAAYHAERFLALTRRHTKAVLLGTAAMVAAGVAWFAIQVTWMGTEITTASKVFQPIVVLDSLAVAWTFLAAGLAWQERGMPGRTWIRAAADASFGVYLSHPLLLMGLVAASTATGLSAAAGHVPGAVLTAIVVLIVVPVTYLTCAAAAAGLRRTPLSLPLTGHPRQRPRVAAAPPAVPVTPGGLVCERQTA